jgi:hypothetical protein
MTDNERLKNLKKIADLMRERDLAKLTRAQAAKTQTEDLLRALDHSNTISLPETTAAAQAVEKYGLWTTNRRIILNQKHARDTARWLSDREVAQRSFGQSDVLSRLLERK